MSTEEHRRLFTLSFLLGLLLLNFAARSGEDCGCRTARPSVASRIVNGTNVPASQFPTVGQVGDTGFNFCTGTLIGPHHVLSAGHCVTDDNGRPNLDPSQARFRLGGVEYRVSQIIVHPTYNGNIDTEGIVDLSILVLTQDVPNVTPTPLFRNTPAVGNVLTLAGYGVTGTGTTGVTDNSPTPAAGTIDFGTTPIDEVTPTFVKWNFENKPAPNTESNTAPGDSGGPAFLTVNGQLFLAGVTSGGSNTNAGYGDHSFDTRVDAAATWIDSIVGSSGNPTPNPGGGGGGGTLSIVSGPSANPNPAAAFESVSFTAAASDSAATISWDFGDGSAPATGSSANHSFAQNGTYTVTATATLNGASDSATLSMQILDGATQNLTISRSNFTLNFRSPFASNLSMRCSNPDFAFSNRNSFYDAFDGRTVEVYIGNQRIDSLEVFGNRAWGEGTLNWNIVRGELNYKVRSGRLIRTLATYGAANDNVYGTVDVPISVRVNGQMYSGSYSFFYRARAGMTGTGR